MEIDSVDSLTSVVGSVRNVVLAASTIVIRSVTLKESVVVGFVAITESVVGGFVVTN